MDVFFIFSFIGIICVIFYFLNRKYLIKFTKSNIYLDKLNINLILSSARKDIELYLRASNVIKEIDSISISELNNMQQDSLIEVKRVFNSRFNELESYKRQFLRNNDNEMVINIENIQDELEKLYEQCLKIKPLISPSVAYQKTKQILDDLYEKIDNCYVKNDSNK